MELTTEAPLVLQEWVSLIVLGCWLIVPAVVGYRRFRSADVI